MVYKILILYAMHYKKCVDPDSEQIRIAVSSALPSVTRNCWREELLHKIRSISIPLTETEKSHMSPRGHSTSLSTTAIYDWPCGIRRRVD